MTEFKGTPFPWHVFGETTVYGPGMGEHGILEEYVAEACYEPEPNGDHPLLGTVNLSVSEDEAKANARLIAAAPDLLTVAQRLDDFQRHFEIHAMAPGYMPGNSYYSDMAMEIVEEARAAITKALGEPS